MPVERKVIGTDANGQPIYAGSSTYTPTLSAMPGTQGQNFVPGQEYTFTKTASSGPSTPGNYISAGLDYVSPDFVSNLFGGSDLPNNYDATGELAKSEAMAGNVYQQALAQSQGAARGGAPSSTVTAQQLAAPGQVTAQTIATPDTLAGAQAADLRAQQLTQAARAAESPSAAAAQMRGAAGLISNQQLGQAAMARGADRAAAKRDAMLATGTQGMVAANQSSALAAAEQAAKQQAYTQALTGVRTGDVGAAQAQTEIGAANQVRDLQAQQYTEANRLEAAKSNQLADLEASKFTAGNTLDAWTAQQQTINAANATALQGVGAQNQAQGTAATYATGQNEAETKNKGAVAGLVGGVVGGLLSDERAKTDVYQIDQPKTDEPYDFLEWEPPKPEEDKQGPGLIGGILQAISDERIKTDTKRLTAADETADLLRSAYGITGDGDPYQAAGGHGGGASDLYSLGVPSSRLSPYSSPKFVLRGDTDPLMMTPADWAQEAENTDTAVSDERTKREVDRMAPDELVNWAEDVPMATFRYKDGAPGTDGGEYYHLGTLAQSLERTGPMGRLMVHERDDGLKEVDYGPLDLAISKAALTVAKTALAEARAARKAVR